MRFPWSFYKLLVANAQTNGRNRGTHNGTNFQPAALPAPQISHLNYAFLNLTINGTV